MAGRIYPIIVRKEYTDEGYREYLHQSFKLERGKYRGGRSKFIPLVMERLVDEHIEEISLDSAEPYQFPKARFLSRLQGCILLLSKWKDSKFRGRCSFDLLMHSCN